MKYITERTMPYIYGSIIFTLVFLGGHLSGMGGSLTTNLLFGLFMGVIACIAITFVIKYGKPKE
jgi:hypothetical protein